MDTELVIKTQDNIYTVNNTYMYNIFNIFDKDGKYIDQFTIPRYFSNTYNRFYKTNNLYIIEKDIFTRDNVVIKHKWFSIFNIQLEKEEFEHKLKYNTLRLTKFKKENDLINNIYKVGFYSYSTYILGILTIKIPFNYYKIPNILFSAQIATGLVMKYLLYTEINKHI